jgi:hypothetical protein
MKRSIFILVWVVMFILPGFQKVSGIHTRNIPTVKGIVFHDKDGNRLYDPSEDKPLKGIAVSNGREVVITNRKGFYELPLRDNSAIFVIKPRNWMVPVGENQMPHFYYLFSSDGISGSQFEGLSATGELPENVNFPLYLRKEPKKFKVLVFGDTQPRDHKEIYYMEQDVLPEVIGIDAAFGVTLGDVVFNDLDLFKHLTSSLSTVGIPWWYVPGNHDIDYSGNNNSEGRGAWYRNFGPSYYSFSYGPVHFIVMDDIRMIFEGERHFYRTGLGEDQMEFLRNEIDRLKKDQLLVLLTHIPYEKSTEWKDESEKKTFYDLIAGHPNTVTLAAHTHQHYHHYIGKEFGFSGEQPHHLVSMGTVCGSWWTGAPDEYGIPHAMMSDGTPNSYGILHIDDNNWKIRWKAAQKPADFQMYIDAPEYVNANSMETLKVTANIYNALPEADVKMRIGNNGEWVSMKRVPQPDPARLAVMEREKQLGEVTWRNLGAFKISEHIWEAEQKIALEPGVHVIYIKATDKWWKYEGKRLLYVK